MPGSIILMNAASMPACPVPLMANVNLLFVLNAYCSPTLTSSITYMTQLHMYMTFSYLDKFLVQVTERAGGLEDVVHGRRHIGGAGTEQNSGGENHRLAETFERHDGGRSAD